MKQARLRNRIGFVIGLLVALIVAVVPLPVPEEVRPDLVALFVIYQAIYHPRLMRLELAFLIGLSVDILLLTILGQHALGLTLLCYFMSRFRQRVVLLNPLRQAPLILLLLLALQIFYAWIYAIGFSQIVDGLSLTAPLVSVLVWMAIVTPLSPASRLQRRFAN